MPSTSTPDATASLLKISEQLSLKLIVAAVRRHLSLRALLRGIVSLCLSFCVGLLRLLPPSLYFGRFDVFCLELVRRQEYLESSLLPE